MKEIINIILTNDLVFFILMISVFLCPYFIRHIIGLIKGNSSDEDNQKIKNVLKQVIPEGEQYIPVYGFYEWGGRRGRPVRCNHYAVGVQGHQIYLVPLTVGKKKVGYDKHYIIKREDISNIMITNITPFKHYITYYYKNGNRFEINVKPVNTRTRKIAPFNLRQKDEVALFVEQMRMWNKTQS